MSQECLSFKVPTPKEPKSKNDIYKEGLYITCKNNELYYKMNKLINKLNIGNILIVKNGLNPLNNKYWNYIGSTILNIDKINNFITVCLHKRNEINNESVFYNFDDNIMYNIKYDYNNILKINNPNRIFMLIDCVNDNKIYKTSLKSIKDDIILKKYIN